MDIQPHSNPERIESSIDEVIDSQGEPVPHNTTTEDTVLTLTGSGTASSIVFIFDNDVLLTPASVTINRTWNFTETVALGRHAFTVRDSLGGVDSPEWVVTVGEAVVTPEITLVTDSNGEIEPDGNTFDTSVTLTGTAKASETVELFQDGALQGDVPVNPSGVWTRPVTGLTVTNHNFQVRGRYGNNPVSNVRSLTVLASDAPTISNIQDAAGVEIPPNTTTFNTSVTLSGTAAAGLQVQIFDGASSLGIVTATGGTWTLPLTGLALKAYRVKAKGLYGSEPESAERVFTVAVATVPTISNIKDANGVEIQPNATTYSTSATLTGTAAAGQQVQILDSATVLGTVIATGGNWTLPLPSLTAKAYRIKAKGLYGSNPESAVRVFRVEPAMVVNPSPVALSGKVFIFAGSSVAPRYWPTNTTFLRTASGGQPPYTYSSSNSAIAPVDSTGRVTSRANGSATITIRDSVGASGSYNVNVTGVVMVHYLGVGNFPAMVNAAASRGLRVPGYVEVNGINGEGISWAYGYNPPLPNQYYWCNEVHTPPNLFYIDNFHTSVVSGADNGPSGPAHGGIGVT